MIIPVILAGGSGTRLWPLSRSMYPKQFLRLLGRKSMLQETINRLKPFDSDNAIVIGNEEHRFLIAEQLRGCGLRSVDILLEPQGRNTAPAIALAAHQAVNKHPEAMLLVLSADHAIGDTGLFFDLINESAKVAASGKLVTFGVNPTRAETGYGYIERGKSVGDGGYEVLRFIEKPNLQTAEKLFAESGYYWNSGIFLFRASDFLNELENFEPEVYVICKKALDNASSDLDFIRPEKSIFETCPAVSVDVGVMERTTNACVVPFTTDWSDVGSWSSLWDISTKDSMLNVTHGDVISSTSCRGSYVYASHRLVATIGIEDLVIVETEDAVLVSRKDMVQDVKEVVDKLSLDGRNEGVTHREVFRPWGAYDSIDVGERYQVKRITVNPGEKLSVQMHHHRAEHWVVVSGTAKVLNGEESYLVSENQSTYIPVGQIHSLENPGVIPLEIIEVQSGSYLGEDDIVRLKDMYGRE
ncbi:mannose-1-phosphate guanylyltransferase/mannose-6-phosphate isomerase [Halomonas sp. H33-56]|uniref:mannose-1-phosphate guanylyltransferase/mannose-6-phosphate isomerase n=1 Tax=Halomonas sp. H33-56 TaxID=2950873 RepID=UPI0032E000CC